MSTCYLCGDKIPEGQGIRKEVADGHSRGSGAFLTNRGTVGLGAGGSTHYGLHTVCPACAVASDIVTAQGKRSDRNMLLRLLMYFGIAAFIIFLIVYFHFDPLGNSHH